MLVYVRNLFLSHPMLIKVLLFLIIYRLYIFACANRRGIVKP